MVSFERFHQNCQAVLAAVSVNGLKGEKQGNPHKNSVWYFYAETAFIGQNFMIIISTDLKLRKSRKQYYSNWDYILR